MAFGSSTISLASGAVGDLFSIKQHRLRAQGSALEKQNYLLAADYADKNAVYTEWSTRIKQAQQDRNLYKSLGQTQSDVASAGFGAGGSALDILRDSAAEGALTRAVIGEQGLITEEGYRVQAQSYRNMAAAAQIAINAENEAASTAWMTAGLKGLGALASLFTPG